MDAPPPQPVPYARIAPLLDGLLEDGADIRFKPLIIEPEVSNGLSVDALRSSLQIAASTNTLDAAQNQANLRILKANSDFQVSEVDQLRVLTSAASDAQSDLAAKTKAATALKAASAAQSDQDAANQAVTDAKTHLADIQSQITTTRGAIKDSIAPASFTSTTPGKNALGVDPTATSPLSGFNPTAPQGFTATLPATRQIDDRIGLLYQRAMSLLSIQGVTSDLKDMNLHYLQFTPSVLYSDRKVANIDIRYDTRCGDGEEARILDVFPRRAVINITNEKYRDRSFSLAAFFGFTGASASAAYNRQHMELTTALAQSSYVSGYGAGSKKFGWVLGRALGEEIIATGQRVFFALVAVPTGCEENLQVGSTQITYLDDKGRELVGKKLPLPALPMVFPKPQIATVKSISYAPVSIPADNSPTPVSIEIGLHPLDPQTVITVNGTAIKRARDNFARATQSQSSTLGGLLETSSLDNIVNVWIPTSADKIQVVLDASKYQDAFPRIVLNSIGYPLDISSDAVLNTTPIMVGTSLLHCTPKCANQLPPLGHPLISRGSIGTALWWRVSGGQRHVAITLSDDVSNSEDRRAIDLGLSVASEEAKSPWGPSPLGFLLTGSEKRPLMDCHPNGIQLVCLLPSTDGTSPDSEVVTIEDSEHSSPRAVRATMTLRLVKSFTPVSTPAPVLSATTKGDRLILTWKFSWQLYSVPPDYGDYLIRLTTNTGEPIDSKGGVDCDNSSMDDCSLRFEIPTASLNQLTDHVEMDIKGGKDSRRLAITNLYKNLSPVIDTFSEDKTHFVGSNLVGNYVMLGTHGERKPVECADVQTRTDCRVASLPHVNHEEYFYLVVGDNDLTPVRRRSDPEGTYVTISPEKHGKVPPDPTHSPKPGTPGAASPVKPDPTKGKGEGKISAY